MDVGDLPRGTFESKYKCLKILHTGASGRVLLAQSKAEDSKHTQLVVKEFQCAKLDKPMYMTMLNEIHMMTALHCPRIPQVMETFYAEDEHKVYHVIQYCSNGPLSVYMRRARATKKRVSEDVVWKVLIGVLEALAYLETYNLEKNCVHRSIKPDNILMDSNHVGMLTDFGIAKEKYKDEFLRQLCGSKNYLSPELLARKEYAEGIDIWALGAVVYELCTLSPLATDALKWEQEHDNNDMGPVTLESVGLLCAKPPSSGLGRPDHDSEQSHSAGAKGVRDSKDPTYMQEFINEINLTCCSSKDTTPYSQDLHRVLRLMLQINPKSRASASMLLATPVVAAIRRYLSEPTNIVLDYLRECTNNDDSKSEYKVIRRLYKNKTGTHVIVKKHTSGALFWAKEVRVEDDTGNTIVAAAHERILYQKDLEHPAVIPCIKCIYNSTQGRILYVYDNSEMCFEQYQIGKPQLSNMVFLDEFLKYNREQKQQLPEYIIWAIILQLLGLLEWLHDIKRIIFRYFSLETILINPVTHAIKVFDFGLSTLYRYPSGQVGSIECMAPEVQSKLEVQMGSINETKLYPSPSHHTYTNKCDLWSLGCIIYRMMTYLPFYSRYFNRTKASYGHLKDITFDNKFVFFYTPYSKTLETTVRLLLVKDPDARYGASQLLKKISLAWLEKSVFGSPANIEQRSLSSSYSLEAVLADTPLFQEFVLLSTETAGASEYSLTFQGLQFADLTVSRTQQGEKRFVARALRISSEDFTSGHLTPYVLSQIKFSRLLTDDCFVPVIDTFFDSQFGLVFVYDCHPAMSLSALCDQRFQHSQAFLEQEIWSIVAQVLVAVAKAHNFSSNGLSLGSIYLSNLTPDSIFIGLDGGVKVLLTGYAQEYEKTGILSATFVGAIPYSAPEKLALIGQPSIGIDGFSEKNDIWALGCILYKLCSDGRSFYDEYNDHRSAIISTKQTQMIIEGLIQWTDSLIEFMGLMLTVLPTDRPSASSLLEYPYLAKAILPYIGSFPLVLTQKKFDRRYLVLDQLMDDTMLSTDGDLLSHEDMSMMNLSKTTSTSELPLPSVDTLATQEAQHLSTCAVDTPTTVSLKVTLKNDGIKQFMVKEFPLNKLLPLSVQELCEVITAMRTLSCDILEKPVDSFVDNSYVYVITEYIHDFPLSTLLRVNKERRAQMPERAIWKVAYLLLSAIQHANDNNYVYGAISPGNIMLVSNKKVSGPESSDYAYLRSDYSVILSDYSMAHLCGQHFTRTILPNYEPYLAPEVLAGKSTNDIFFTPTSDVWAAGATLFEMCFNVSFSQYLLDNESAASALRLGKQFKMPSAPYSRDLIEMIRMMLVVDSSRRQAAGHLLHSFSSIFSAVGSVGLSNFVFPFPIPCRRLNQYSTSEPVSEDKENGCRLLKVKRNIQPTAPVALALTRNSSIHPTYNSDADPDDAVYFCQEVKLVPKNQRILHQLLLLSISLFFYQHKDILTTENPTSTRPRLGEPEIPFLTNLVDVYDDLEKGCMCLVTEATDDGTAEDLLVSLRASSTGLSQTQFFTICDQLIQALERVYMPVPFYVATMSKPLTLRLCHASLLLSNVMLLSEGAIKLNIFHALYPLGLPISAQTRAILGDICIESYVTIDYNLDFWCLGALLFTLYTHKNLCTALSAYSSSKNMKGASHQRSESSKTILQMLQAAPTEDLIDFSLPIYLNHLQTTEEHASVTRIIRTLLCGTTDPVADLFSLRCIINPDLANLEPLKREKPDDDKAAVDLSSSGKVEEDTTIQMQQSQSFMDSRKLTLRDDTSELVDSVIHRSSINSAEPSTQTLTVGTTENSLLVAKETGKEQETQKELNRYSSTPALDILEPEAGQSKEEEEEAKLIKLLKKKFGSSLLRNKYMVIHDEESSTSHSDTILVRPLNASIASKELFRCHYIDLLKVQSPELRNAIILEAQLLLSFNHRNIHKYIDAFYDKEVRKLCIISEQLSSFTLADVLVLYSDASKPVEEYNIWKCAEELLAALSYIQEFKNSMGQVGTFANLAISPSNLRFSFTEDAEIRIGTLKLCDFTCCVYLGDPTGSQELNIQTAILSTNDMYMSQDALRTKYGYKKTYDALMQDIWSVGAILYEMATLKQAYTTFFNADMASYDLSHIDINVKHDVWATARNYTPALNTLISTILRGQAKVTVLAAMTASSDTLQNMKLLNSKMPKRHLKDDYEILDFLCDMNISKLYKIRNLLNGHILTCKETTFTSIDAYVVQLLDSETTILKKVMHENIAPLLDYFYDEDRYSAYIITDFFVFGNVASLITRYLEKREPIPETTIWGIACETLKGLEYLHSTEKAELSGLKVVHRNIRPEALFLTKDGKVHIFDFCLAKVISATGTKHGTIKAQIYASAGTLGYMAPEVLAIQSTDQNQSLTMDGYDEKCDIWSLGSVLYELCTLRPLAEDFPMLKKTGHGFTGVTSIQPTNLGDTIYSAELLTFINLLLLPSPKTRLGAKDLLQVPEIKALWATPDTSDDDDAEGIVVYAPMFDDRVEDNDKPNAKPVYNGGYMNDGDSGLNMPSLSGLGSHFLHDSPHGLTKTVDTEIKAYRVEGTEESESGISIAGVRPSL